MGEAPYYKGLPGFPAPSRWSRREPQEAFSLSFGGHEAFRLERGANCIVEGLPLPLRQLLAVFLRPRGFRDARVIAASHDLISHAADLRAVVAERTESCIAIW